MIGGDGWHGVRSVIPWVGQQILLQCHHATSGVVLLCDEMPLMINMC